ncbi:MAG TPA: TrkH family potassium uptake protein [Candidatus Tectomicrobia bacterium]|nr:TrkH family potassium uptake protein [Candidatus Tectomicrobia bacterium]
MRWKPRIDSGREIPAALRMLLRLTPLALLGLGIEALYPDVRWLRRWLEGAYYGVVGLFALQLSLDFLRAGSQTAFFRTRTLDMLLLLPLALATDGLRIAVGFVALRQTLEITRSLMPLRDARRRLTALRFTPARVVALSFAATILAGTVLLMLPAATAERQGTALLDALFTATSAVCVTGLIVLDTPKHFSTFGQVVLIGLIQVGGLGIMTFSTFLAIALGRRMGMQGRVVMQDLLEEQNIETVKSTIVGILKMTFTVEAIGALVLTWAWYTPGDGLQRALLLGVFHSISAFNNAGFALFSDSLMRYRGDLLINLTVTTLIIIGGLGFTVISGLLEWRFWGKARVPRLSCHSRMVLTTTGILLAGGTLMFFMAEYSKSMADWSWTDLLLSSYFQAVTSRTAGFNTIDTASLTDLSLFITIILMFIGASPTGTGGGVKTTTLALLVLSVRAILRKRDQVEVFYRTIPREMVHKALVIITFSFSLINLFTIALLFTDEARFLATMFEVVSAFGTVGLSMGLTPSLTAAGKVIIIIVMFIGRIGPLTMAVALGEQPDRARYAYPTERVMVG